ncbi:MAG TPA: glycosyltransferase, partial [Solirubrobacteraceae bacterium]
RFIEWGLPAEKVMLEEYGRTATAGPVPPEDRPRRDRLAFFGQLSPYKGVDVLLEAMRELGRERRRGGAGGPRLRVHGANLDLQEHAFQERFHRLLDETRDAVTYAGEYTHAQQSGLMAAADWVIVPSIWWENSPLVIQEAFMHGKPVICSDIGGMAEKVADGVNGLHFRVGDPVSLARVIERAVESPALWDALRAGIPAVHGMADHVPVIEDAYERLLAQRAAAWEVEAL